MNVLVKYIDFHSDNYQGGSGKSFELKTLVRLEPGTLAIDIKDVVMDHLYDLAKEQKPFRIDHD
ncbi:MAG TPA: hypothetical protein DDY18_04555 [Flavobacterium sp.]|jgi:hypothetical protein|nr:hypothetical protein [Flavobacterium sp.]